MRPAAATSGFAKGCLAEKELKEQGILTEEPQQKVEELHTAVIITGVLAVVAVALMYIGFGATLTWIGAILFFATMFWFTRISMKGSERTARSH